MARRRSSGRFTVTGPGVDHAVPSVGAGMSAAQTFATQQRHVDDELTFYVRDLIGDQVRAVVTKRHDGVIETRHI